MTHSPNAIAALARAALVARVERDRMEAGRPGREAGNAARRAWWAKQEAYEQAVRDPATVLALCERLAWAESRLNQLDAEHFDRLDILPCDFMNQPLTPEPAGAGGLPGGAARGRQ